MMTVTFHQLRRRVIGGGAIALALTLMAAVPEGAQPIVSLLSDAPVADAAQSGNVTAVRTLLREGEDVNASQGDGMTALHWAAYQGDLELVDVLLYAGANLEATTRIAGYTPLLIGARTGHGAAVEALIAAGANASVRTSTGVTALHFAAGAGQAGAVQALLDAGIPVDVREEVSNQTPLHFAANGGRTEAIRALIAAGADPNAITKISLISQLEAEDRVESTLRRERERAAEALRTAEAEAILEMEFLQLSPEEQAAKLRADSIAEAAAKAEADSIAAERAAAREAAAAARAEAEPDRDLAPDDDPVEEEEESDEEEEEPLPRLGYGDLVGGMGGMSALHIAVREGYRDAAVALIEGGADINQKSGGDESSPMVIASINGYFDLALELMELGADPNLASHAGVTPLWAAINVKWAPRALYPQPKAHERQEIDYLGFMEALLQAGADPDARVNRHIWFMSYNFDLLGINTTGASVFWRAAYGTDVPAMKLLVEYGADHTVPTSKPPTGRAFDPDVEDDSGLPPIPVGGPAVYPIHAASGAGYGQDFASNSHQHAPDGWIPSVKYLVEELGADVNARDEFGYTPLHHAAARGDNDLIEYLVLQGADVMAVARNGNTTADMANAPQSRVEPFPETIALLVGLGAVNNNNCRSCQ